MQVVAYGGTKAAPFQQGICESQALEPGITGNFTYHQMDLLASALGCNESALDSNETLSCLREADLMTYLNASIETYSGDVSNNIGDCWLPVVDNDFLPAAPSILVSEHRMANVTMIIGWCDDDLGFFTPRTISTSNDTRNFVTSYLPDLNETSTDDLLGLYPVTDFAADPAANLSAEFYRSSRIFRDVLMVCMPTWFGEQVSQMGNNAYLYDQNASVLITIVEGLGYPGLGPPHTSEFAYIYANLSHYNISGLNYAPTEEDFALVAPESRSWSSFAAVGQPSLESKDTLQGWEPAFQYAQEKNQTDVYVIGGRNSGLSATEGESASQALAKQKLKERCAFLNSAGIIEQLRF
jgi:carboxylesterase type B